MQNCDDKAVLFDDDAEAVEAICNAPEITADEGTVGDGSDAASHMATTGGQEAAKEPSAYDQERDEKAARGFSRAIERGASLVGAVLDDVDQDCAGEAFRLGLDYAHRRQAAGLRLILRTLGAALPIAALFGIALFGAYKEVQEHA